jgi:4-hydroxy-3-polyprenylbenzoate decarboxylase
MSSQRRILVAVTGASGVRYGLRLAEVLAEKGLLEAVLASRAAEQVARAEEGISLEKWADDKGFKLYWDYEIDAPYSSSSRAVDAVAVAPCSMRTLAAVAHGLADNLITRAVLAHLRLRRPVVLVIRETPLGLAELRNMLLAAENGATILPASPGFYHRPRSVEDMVDFVVGKVLDVLGVSHSLYRRWRG